MFKRKSFLPSILGSAIFLIFFVNDLYSQNYIWEKSTISSKIASPKSSKSSSFFRLNVDEWEHKLKNISEYRSESFYFPIDETHILFQIRETRVMHPNLEAKFPDIRSFSGVSNDGTNRTIYFTYSHNGGFFGVYQSAPHERVEIKPVEDNAYQFSLANSQNTGSEFMCETETQLKQQMKRDRKLNRDIDDGNLRRYKLALSVSGDYSLEFLDGSEANDQEKKTKVLQGMVTSVNRLNGIFERDFGVTLQLIENTDTLIFLNPFTDPYTSGFALRSQLVQTLNSNLSEEDYHVGHLFHKETNRKYGNAGCIACVCTDGQKGQAYSVHGDPTSDDMNLLAAHEFGHQFGAFHTQSSLNCRSGFNSEVEPGSGSTIMSYAGICPPNVQAGSDDYFNYTSIRDVANWTIDQSSCPELIPNNNSAPIIDEVSNHTIPKSTPFVLDTNVSDSDGIEFLTYCWEQNDSQNPNSTGAPRSTNIIGPMFRSLPPSANSSRYFPNLVDIVANNLNSTWEVLPSVSRQLNFALTVRDNGTNGGQAVSEAVRIDVDGEAGPFLVTSQNDNSEVWTVGDLVTVSWDVAGTDTEPIGADMVEIILSLDGGVTFTESILTTENDGSETFNLPDTNATLNARVMIKAVDNVFFAVNQKEFEIQKSEFTIFPQDSQVIVCNSEDVVFNVLYKTFLDFEEEVIVSASNLPDGTSVSFSQDTFNESSLDGTPFIVTLSGLEGLETGNYTFSVNGLSTSNIEKETQLTFSVYETHEAIPVLAFPVNNDNSIELDTNLVWESNDNASSYRIEIASDNSFEDIIEEFTTEQTTFTPTSLENNRLYYWRVQYLNPCGGSDYSIPFSFSTICAQVKDLSFVSVDIDSIELSWEDDSESSSWTVEYGGRGFTLGTGTSSQASSKSFTADGLNSGTAYDFYVSGNCSIGGNSDFAGPLIISTESDFCNGDHFYDSGGPENNYNDNENITTTISPDSENERVRVRFNTFNVHQGYDFLRVYSGNDNTGLLLGTFTGSELRGEQLVSVADSGSLTFEFSSNSFINLSGWDATVTCEEKPNCFSPRDFLTTSIKGDEVSFQWTAVGDDANWQIEYGLAGFDLGSGSMSNTSETEITVSELTPLTSYEFYIRTICDDGGFSEVLGPFLIETTELCSTPSGLNVLSVTNDTAVIEWENLNDEVSAWEVEYGLNGFILGTGTSQSTLEQSISIEELQSNSSYQLYVRSNCSSEGDGYSEWMGPVSFLTTPDYCNGDHFYDSGGPNGNYSNRENTLTVIHPKTLEERIRVKFNSFLVESCCDRLSVYDGPNTESPLIGRFNRNPGTLKSTHESGALTFLFTSDGSVTSLGWDADVVCQTKPNCSAPVDFRLNNIGAKNVELSWNQTGDDGNWTLEYGLAGFDLGEGTQVISETKNYNLENLTPETNYDVYLKTNCADGGFSDIVGPLNFSTRIACFAPGVFRSATVSSTTADISWENGTGNENEWEVEYGIFGFELGTGTKTTVATNSILIENLEPNTNYEIYVRANCGDDGFSTWSSGVSFKTECTTLLASYKESFVKRREAPDCWSQGDERNWNFDTSAWDGSMYVRDRSSLKNSNYAWLNGYQSENSEGYFLYSPWVDISNLENPATTFSVYSHNYRSDIYNTLNVTLRDSDGTTFNDIITVNNSTKIWKDFVINLSDYEFTSDEIQVEFRVNMASSFERRYNNILIDEVNFGELPTCTNPINPEVSNVTGNSADFTWESSDDEVNWEIQYGFSGFTPAGATTVFTTERSLTLSELEPERSYDIYVRAVCEIGDSSEFIGPITFRTTELCITPSNFRWIFSTKNTAQLMWDAVQGDAEWEVEYGTGFFSPGEGIKEVVSDNQITLENLTPDTSYKVYLRRTCGKDGNSRDSQLWFRTAIGCTAPVGLDLTSVTKDSATLTWNNNDDAIEWEVEYNSGYFSPGNGIGTSFTVNSNTATIEGLQPDTFYYVYVRSNCGEDGYSTWSRYVRFVTPESCSAPQGFNITNRSNNSVSFEWDSADDAIEWEIEYNQSYFAPGNGVGITQVVNSNEISIENLLPATGYYVYIRTNCGEDGHSRWSNYYYFVTEIACRVPSNFRSTETSGNSISLTWNNEGDSDEWEIEYYPGFFTPGSGIGSKQVSAVNEITIEDLISNTSYYMYIRSNCGEDDGYSNWSRYIIITTPESCSVPNNFRMTSSDISSATLEWSTVQNGNEWDIEYNETPFAPGFGTRQTFTENMAVIENLQSNTSYYAYLRQNCGEDGYSRWTEVLTFRTQGDFCGGDHFYDTGGPFGSYSNNENVTTVITPENEGDRVKVTFNSFSLESCCDRLRVYNGPNTESPLIATLTSFPSEPIESTHESGALTFVFTSDSSSTRSGWDATVLCGPVPNCESPINFVNTSVTASSANFAWNQVDSEISWILEYGIEGFNLGTGIEFTSNENLHELTGLESSTTYDIYIKTSCSEGGYSDVVGPLTFVTACGSDEDDLIVNGSFECGSLSGWTLGGPESFLGCTYNFAVLTSSDPVCGSVNEIIPTDGEYAAFTSFDGSGNIVYSLSQAIRIPDNINSFSIAELSFDFLVNYRMIFNNPTQERVFEVRFTDLEGVQLFLIDELKFGLNPDTGEIEHNYQENIINQLTQYAGETILLNFQAYVPENFTGPAKAMLDNISLVLDDILSNSDKRFRQDKLTVYPVPNKGVFTVKNYNKGLIELVEVFDVSGRLIQVEKLAQPLDEVEISLQSVTSGVYFVDVYIDANKYTRRIIVE